MSRGRPPQGEVGFQYPGDLEGNTSIQAIEAFRIAYENINYLRAVVQAVKNSSIPFDIVQLRALILSLIPKSASGKTNVIIGTHQIRITVYAAPQTLTDVYFEYDRNAIYIATNGSTGGGVLQWQLASSAMVDVLASRPSDLGTSDAGFEFTDSTTINETQYVWLGAKWITGGGYLQEIADAVTAAVTTVLLLRHTTSGAAGSGYGGGLDVELEDSGAVNRLASQDQVSWRNAGTTTAGRALFLRIAGVLTQCLDLTSTALTALGNLVFNAGTAFTGTLTHAAGSNVVWTMPPATGNITYETAALTNNNFTLGGGGALVKDAGFAIVPLASGGSAASTAAGARATFNAAAIQAVGGNGAGTYTMITSITVTAEGTVSSISGS